MRLILLLSPIFLFTIISCDKQEIPEEDMTRVAKEFPGVKEEFWPHFQEFEEESAQRGKEIDLVKEGITTDYDQARLTTEEEVAGSCRYNSDKPNSIAIDSVLWNNATYYRQELIIFHELGHCSLERDHKDDSNADGTCKSLMRSHFNNCLLFYNKGTRQVYLDELFSL